MSGRVVLNVRRGDKVTWCWLFIITAAVTYAILAQRHQVSENHATSKAACVRTREIAPRVADDLERAGALRPSTLRLYRKTIPTKCP